MKVDKLVPEVYYKESRDFSFVGRLFEVLLNYMKTGADLVDSNLNSENIKGEVLDLLLSTLGFESKHKYITKDIVAIASSFSELLKKKGTQNAIEEAITILLTSQELNYTFDIQTTADDPYTLNVVVPYEMNDIILLEDLLKYILPAGLILNINPGQVSEVKAVSESESHDKVQVYNSSYMDQHIGNIYYNLSSDTGLLVNELPSYDFSSITTDTGKTYTENVDRTFEYLGTIVTNYDATK